MLVLYAIVFISSASLVGERSIVISMSVFMHISGTTCSYFI